MGKSSCSKVGEKALIIDQFAKPFEFMLPNGSKKYRSLLGSVLTLVTVIIVALYSIYKWQVLIDRDEYTLSQITEENYFNETRTSKMDRSTDFNLAFGIYSNRGIR